jgi:hypothetical protein
VKRLASEDLSTYEGIMDAMIKGRERLVDILEGITDKESARAAKPALREIAKRERELWAAIKNLGEPKFEEKRRIMARVGAAMEELNSRTDETLDRLRADAGMWAVVDRAMKEYFDAAAPEPRADASRTEDMDRMMELAHLVARAEALPLRDGAFDPYAFVGTGDITREGYVLFRSARLGKGPTDEQIERGDYTNFPWERYRGDGSETKKLVRIPLLWEREPGPDGWHLVAWSDGSCGVVSPAELRAALPR